MSSLGDGYSPSSPKKWEPLLYAWYTYHRDRVGEILYECWYHQSDMTIVTSRQKLLKDEFWRNKHESITE